MKEQIKQHVELLNAKIDSLRQVCKALNFNDSQFHSLILEVEVLIAELSMTTQFLKSSAEMNAYIESIAPTEKENFKDKVEKYFKVTD